MAVWAFVGLTGIVVTTAYTDVVLIASFELLETLDLAAVVVQNCVDTLSLLVALNSWHHAFLW